MGARRPPVNQAQVAAALGTADSTISACVKEDRIPRPPMCQRLADYFHVPVEDVIRAAGHLPPLSEPAPEPELSRQARELAFLYDSLAPDDREVLTHIAQRLHAEPPPAAPSAQA